MNRHPYILQDLVLNVRKSVSFLYMKWFLQISKQIEGNRIKDLKFTPIKYIYMYVYTCNGQPLTSKHTNWLSPNYFSQCLIYVIKFLERWFW